MAENPTRTMEVIIPSDKSSTKMAGDPTFNSSMSILLLQLTCMIAVFLITLAGALLPLKVIGFKSVSIQRRQRSEKILSYCNCLAGGVFLATCFLGLLPSAREKFQEIFDEENTKVEYPLCEAIMVLGFFLILGLEQLALSVQQQWQSRGSADEIQMKNVSLKFTAKDGRVKVDTAQLDSEEDEDLFTKDSDRAPMLASSGRSIDGRNGAHHRAGERQADDGDMESGNHSHHGNSQGHSHLDVSNSGLLRSLILLFALSTHSIFEGMVLGLQEDIKSILYLLIAMLAHESLAAFALGASLLKNSVNTYAFIIYGVLFAGMIPAGIALGLWIRASPGFGAIICSAVMQSIAAGIFIFVTFFEILNHEFEGQANRPQKIAFAVLGYVVLAALEAVG